MASRTETSRNPSRIRLLVADDHAIVRKGICALLATESDIEVVGEAADGQQAVNKAQELHPDVILMDLVMPGMDGFEATHQITTYQPEVRVLVLTGFAADDKVFPAFQAGALGYLLKNSSPEELVQAIRRLYRGESSLDPAITRRVLREFSSPAGPEPGPLTEREVEVLRLVAQGWTNREISARLSIRQTTVCSHVSSILSKLRVSSRTQAALYALRKGIASLQDTDV